MTLTDTRYEHIALDEEGRPLIAGTTMKVIELVEEHLAYGWSPDELQVNHSYLSMGQIYSALAYYADHQQALDKVIAEESAEVQRLWEANRNSPIRQKLRARGLM